MEQIEKLSKNADREISLKKFKTTEALVKAYNALEAEFTKRSQRLRELERRIGEGKRDVKEDFAAENDGERGALTSNLQGEENGRKRTPHPYAPPTEGNYGGERTKSAAFESIGEGKEKTVENEGKGEKCDGAENERKGEKYDGAENAEKTEKSGGIEAENIAIENGEGREEGMDETEENDRAKNMEIREKGIDEIEENGGAENAGEPQNPVRFGEDWEKSVDKFVEKHPFAAELASEIADEFVDDGNSAENCLENAYLRVLERRYSNPERSLGDGEFLEKYVFYNPIVKDKIIADYLDGLQKDGLPKLMARGGAIPVSPPHKPKNLAEAAHMAREMLGS
jgi:hypothetical protein